MGEPAFQSALVIVDSKTLVDVSRGILKELEVSDIHTPVGADQGMQLLHEEPNALLVVEWNETTGLALAMLEENLKIPQLIPRPILLICHGEVENLEGLASEFNISQIYLGDINKNGIKEKLEILRDAEYIEKEVRERYQTVTDTREAEGWEKSRDLLQELVDKFPNDERLKLELAENFFRLDQINDAIKVLEPLASKETICKSSKSLW